MKIWNYYIPSKKGEGWGKFIIDSTGYFSCVSDYGNYAFQWTAHGDNTDFREFLCELDNGYLMGKLSNGQRKFDLYKTIEKMKREAITNRRATMRGEVYENHEVSKECIRDMWDELEGAGNEYECTKIIDHYYSCFPDPCEILVYDFPYDLQALATRLWPRFVEALKEDLKNSEKVYKEVAVGQ